MDKRGQQPRRTGTSNVELWVPLEQVSERNAVLGLDRGARVS
jgi:hypothetical protein